VVDDPAHLPELSRHIFIPVAAKLLQQYLFYLLDDYLVLHHFSLFIDAMGSGPYRFVTARALVIKAAGSQASPFQQTSNRDAP
jgi:hypothetical protein